jgi:hypothetical protein
VEDETEVSTEAKNLLTAIICGLKTTAADKTTASNKAVAEQLTELYDKINTVDSCINNATNCVLHNDRVNTQNLLDNLGKAVTDIQEILLSIPENNCKPQTDATDLKQHGTNFVKSFNAWLDPSTSAKWYKFPWRWNLKIESNTENSLKILEGNFFTAANTLRTALTSSFKELKTYLEPSFKKTSPTPASATKPVNRKLQFFDIQEVSPCQSSSSGNPFNQAQANQAQTQRNAQDLRETSDLETQEQKDIRHRDLLAKVQRENQKQRNAQDIRDSSDLENQEQEDIRHRDLLAQVQRESQRQRIAQDIRETLDIEKQEQEDIRHRDLLAQMQREKQKQRKLKLAVLAAIAVMGFEWTIKNFHKSFSHVGRKWLKKLNQPHILTTQTPAGPTKHPSHNPAKANTPKQKRTSSARLNHPRNGIVVHDK